MPRCYYTSHFILPVCKNCNALKCVSFRPLAYVMQIVQMTGRPPFIDLYIKVISPRTNLMLYLFNLSLSYCCERVEGWDKNNTRERPSGICPDLHIRLSPVALYFSISDADTPLGMLCSVISVVFTNKKGELKCSKFKMFFFWMRSVCVFVTTTFGCGYFNHRKLPFRSFPILGNFFCIFVYFLSLLK